jgi:cyclopropane-fatty-acyl-phospholipid synthase
MDGVADRLVPVVERVIGNPLPVNVRAWDGSAVIKGGEAPTLVLNNEEALRHLVWSPSELGMARAYVVGDLDVEGDLFDFFRLLADAFGQTRKLGAGDLAAVLRTGVALGAVGRRPPIPVEEAVPRKGLRHTLLGDRQAIAHHYDVGNDFYRQILGPSLVYSCAYYSSSDEKECTLEDAQAAKLDLVCRKLGLRPGMRMLDVGCGWGSLLLHAATEYGITGVGITLSNEQAKLARERISEAGLSEQVEIRVQDYREIVDGPFDAISSIGMAEHVGQEQFLTYCARMHALLAPGGRLLNHQIARRPGSAKHVSSPFIMRYVFPDGELLPVGNTVEVIERAGFEVRDVESIREHYALTLRAWVRNLEANWDDCVARVGEGRARVWRAYMAGSAVAFECNRIGVNQVLAVRTPADGTSGLPYRPRTWLESDEPARRHRPGA